MLLPALRQILTYELIRALEEPLPGLVTRPNGTTVRLRGIRITESVFIDRNGLFVDERGRELPDAEVLRRTTPDTIINRLHQVIGYRERLLQRRRDRLQEFRQKLTRLR